MDRGTALYLVAEMNEIHQRLYPRHLSKMQRELLRWLLHYYNDLLFQGGYEAEVEDDHYVLRPLGGYVEYSPAAATTAAMPVARPSPSAPQSSPIEQPRTWRERIEDMIAEFIDALYRTSQGAPLTDEQQSGYEIVQNWFLSLPQPQRITVLWRLIRLVEQASRKENTAQAS